MRFDDTSNVSALMADRHVAPTNKLRSSLTILGCECRRPYRYSSWCRSFKVLNKAFADQIESLGSNTIFVSKFEPSFGPPPRSGGRSIAKI
jgi:hypothetical protein